MSDFTIAAVCHFSLIVFFVHSFITIYMYPLQKNSFLLWARAIISWFPLCIPFLIWLIYGNQSFFIADQAKQACNFELNLILLCFITPFSIPFITLLLEKFNGSNNVALNRSLAASYLKIVFIFIQIYGICIAAYAGYNALNGMTYRYPFTINFIK